MLPARTGLSSVAAVCLLLAAPAVLPLPLPPAVAAARAASLGPAAAAAAGGAATGGGATGGGAAADAAPASPARPAAKARPEPAADPWAEVARLIAHQQLAQAAARLEPLRADAERRGDDRAWARALVLRAEVRIALHGYETAVRELKEARWPSSPLARTELLLYYGHSLAIYVRTYSWEIQRRERVATGDVVDLKLWTQKQIVAAAEQAYLEAWRQRGAFGIEAAGNLHDVLVPNTYPREVRGTLRDALSYLFVELLADSSLWTPEETNGTYLLDLPRLLAMDGAGAAAVKLDGAAGDGAAHPVEKLVAVLADLESWHAAAGRRAAALEARLERARRLHAAFEQDADRRRIREDLAARLPAARAVAWWAEGQAVLAGLLEADPGPGALPAARAAALAGMLAYPAGAGAEDCRLVAARIEAPAFRVEAMTSDGLGRRSLAVHHKNLARLFFRAYRVDVAGRLASGANEPFPPAWQPREILALGPPAASWAADLPATPDFREHRTYVVPPIAAPGAFMVVASARESFHEGHNQLVAAPLVLGDLVLLGDPDGGAAPGGSAHRLRVLAGSTGAPLAGVEIRVYRRNWQRGGRVVATLSTDAAGAASFEPPAEDRDDWWGYTAIAGHGDDVALLWVRHQPPAAPGGQATLVFTDRSVYRPGQTVRWKVLAYDGDRRVGRLALAPGHAVIVKLLDPNQQEVASVAATTNGFGTAAGELTVPAGRPLGYWELRTDPAGAAGIQVEEYKRPTFEVTVREPAEAPRLNRAAAFRGEARYYFGLPLTAGEVRWRVTREPVFPYWWWWGEWPDGTGAGRGGRGSQVVAAGKSPIGQDGGFTARFVPAADERLGAEVTYRYSLSAEVTDEGGETRTAERSFRLGFVAVEAAVESEREFLDPQRAAAMTVVRRDLDGAPRPGRGAWRLVELRQPDAPLLPADEPVGPPGPGAAASSSPPPFRTPGDDLAPRWQAGLSRAATLRRFADGREVARGEAVHDAQGRATVALPPLPPGAYRLRYETRDDFGGAASAQREFLVAGERPLAVAAWLEVQRTSVRVGDTLAVLVHSGFTGQPLELEIRRREGVERRRLLGGATPLRLDLAVRDEDRGGIGFRLVAVRDHQLLVQDARTDVPWDDHELAITWKTFRDRLRPGARETWRLEVTQQGAHGAEPAVAELLAYMYDRSLDAYAPHHPPRPLDLWPRGIALAEPSASLGHEQAMPYAGRNFVELPPGAKLQGDTLRRLDSYGIGGPGEMITVTAESPLLDGKAIRAEAAVGGVRGGVAGGVVGGVAGGVPGGVIVDRMNVGGNEAGQQSAYAKAAAPPPPPPPRSNFAETAFWQPHLLTGPDGTAAIELTVPDSVTSWSVWVHALTRDFRSGADRREARSVKELMVRPYVPRFLREGDAAELKVVVDDAADRPLDGEVALDVVDPETDASLLADFGVAPAAAHRPFHVEPGRSTSVTFSLAAPRRLGPVALRVVGTAPGASDGELRPLPVLPSRVHLAQSRFVALHGRETRAMTFDDMKRGGDPTRLDEQLVVTLDAQLFYGVLAAVPYLVEYPYECTEQTLNRFLSTAILGSLFDRYPAVARMARQLAAARDTEVEAFGGPDPNRAMALEETPWLLAAQGKRSALEPPLVKVLDPRIAGAQRESALAKLVHDQLPNGAFPWWSGGPPSDFMTLYLLYGFAKAGEFKVEVPREVVVRGWRYLGEKYERELRHQLDNPDCDCAWELLTFLNYVASAYPDPSWLGNALPETERRRILDASFRHWREHSPYLKGLLALTLARMGRPADARLVFASVMDSAKTTPELGTFWQPEDRSWLWYHDTIESHAFALRALLELAPDDRRADGLVQWLFLNKQLNHWKSTRATAEVVYSLARYLDGRRELAVREAARVEAAGEATDFVFEPDRYTGRKAQVVVPGARLGPQAATVTVAKETPGLLFASATWHFSTEELPREARGDLFAVERRYFRRAQRGRETVLEPLAAGAVLAPGDEVEVQLSLRSKAAAEYVHLRDPRAAGLEPGVALSGWQWDLGLPRYEEVRDSGTNFFFERLPAGEYTLRYRVHAALGGTFRVGPATVQSMYAPEFTAYSAGDVLRVAGAPGPSSRE